MKIKLVMICLIITTASIASNSLKRSSDSSTLNKINNINTPHDSDIHKLMPSSNWLEYINENGVIKDKNHNIVQIDSLDEYGYNDYIIQMHPNDGMTLPYPDEPFGITKIGTLNLDDWEGFYPITHLNILKGVRELNNLSVTSSGIDNVQGLSNLIKVHGSISLSNNNISDISSLNNIKMIKNNLLLNGNSISNIRSLSNITFINKANISIHDNLITDLSPFNSIFLNANKLNVLRIDPMTSYKTHLSLESDICQKWKKGGLSVYENGIGLANISIKYNLLCN
jgi:hypothetical protein